MKTADTLQPLKDQRKQRKTGLTFKDAWEFAARTGGAITRPSFDGEWLCWNRWPHEDLQFENYEWSRGAIGHWLRSAPRENPPAPWEQAWSMVRILMQSDTEAADWIAQPLPVRG